MITKKKFGIGVLLAAMLVISMAFVPAVSAEDKIGSDQNLETKAEYTIGNAKVTLDNYPDLSGATLTVESKNFTSSYVVEVDKSDNMYVTNIYDLDGKLIKTDSYSLNPLISSNGNEPLIIINSIIVDADIDIYPDKYSYNDGEYGTVNVEVDNYAFPDGSTGYYLRIPLPVEYIEVYDGLDPDYVYNLPTSSDFVFIANKGVVYGPATILYWQDLHTFGYDELIKVKVKYDDTGSFNLYAYDHEQEIASGLPAWDDDDFDVTVS
ncbi:hypothetical protein [Methanosarcina sp. WH1]|uniref:hypothetical protein n=1 Tax=Methanosarcina sp. WH1 TaxID=1434102 RepID=UPI00064ECEB9|nr:hypothetical protein [Methanosarcina sp. WH1]